MRKLKRLKSEAVLIFIQLVLIFIVAVMVLSSIHASYSRIDEITADELCLTVDESIEDICDGER